MRCLVPLACFDQLGLPVFASDARGVVRFCNPPATRLLDPDTSSVLGTPCWRLARLRTPDDLAFCARDCALRRQVRAGQAEFVRRVALGRGAAKVSGFSLMAFVVPRHPQGRYLLWHVLRPIPALNALACRALSPELRDQTRRLHLLSPRELQILTALSAGLTPAAVGDELFISAVTVRNHIQHILGKLRLHRLVDAVLVALADRPAARPAP